MSNVPAHCFTEPIAVANATESTLIVLMRRISLKRFPAILPSYEPLAAALGKPSTALYGDGQKPMFHHSRRHTYLRVPGSE